MRGCFGFPYTNGDVSPFDHVGLGERCGIEYGRVVYVGGFGRGSSRIWPGVEI